MRGLLTFLVLLAIVFFAVGETAGWYLGLPGQTPVLVYKKERVTEVSVRTVNRSDMPLTFTGDVKRGSVNLEVRYQRPSSFQTGQAAGAQQVIHQERYTAGQRINFDRRFSMGGGIYTVVLAYHDATGIFQLRHPRGSEL